VVDGHYSIKDCKLGEGSFAKTYLAVDTKTGKQLACKMIEKKNLIDKINLSKNKSLTKEYFINALKNEVKTWKAIHHHNIVEFIDFSETANNIYFFLEYCAAGNLETYLTVNGHLPESKALPLFLQLAKGCAYLENKNIYHRDLKTENILITTEGR
jgi:serine/threonine protein kinase